MRKKKENANLNVSRRQFIKGAGVLALAGAAGLAGLNLESCSTTATSVVTQTSTITVAGPTSLQPSSSAPPPTTSALAWPVSITTGKITFSPAHAPVGGSVTASGTGFTASTAYSLMWQDVIGSWDVRSDGNFYGHIWTNNWISVASVQTDAQGNFSATFTVPPGFGFTHTLYVLQGSAASGTIKGQNTFQVDMQASMTGPASGPVGSPITISVTGMGWQDYLNGWGLTYDNGFTGVVTSQTTHGSATATIPATGWVGKHVIQLIETAWSLPFMNIGQSPYPQCPTFTFNYEITIGNAVMPQTLSQQSLPTQMNVTPASTGSPQIWTDVYLGVVGTPMHIIGNTFTPGATVNLAYWTQSGSRVSGGGYQMKQVTIGTTTVASDGTINYAWSLPDTIGGTHTLTAVIGTQTVAQTTFDITPSAIHIMPSSGPVGTVMDIELKGGSWTETANCMYMVVDNKQIGYVCGFNNNGTVNVPLPAAGQMGWHYVDFYPGIYKGTDTDTGIDLYRDPMLTYTDHPYETIPVFHFAFQVTG